MKTRSDLYDDISFGITLVGFAATFYGMYDNVNVSIIAAGLGAGIIAGSVNYIRQGFLSRKEKGEKLEQLFI